MVEGLKLQIASEKLGKLLMGRVEYHSQKAQWAEKKAAELQPEVAGFEDQAEQLGKYTAVAANRNPAQMLREQAKHHSDRATVFRFMAENLIPNETYVLTENDLQRIEVIRPGW